MGPASAEMQMIPVNSKKWAASLRWAGIHRSTHDACANTLGDEITYDLLIDNGRQVKLDIKHKISKWK